MKRKNFTLDIPKKPNLTYKDKWKGRTDAIRGSLRYQDWLETKNKK